MKVSEVMTTEVESVQMNSTLEEVASIMKVENVGAVPVLDEDEDLVGIITDRDMSVLKDFVQLIPKLIATHYDFDGNQNTPS